MAEKIGRGNEISITNKIKLIKNYEKCQTFQLNNKVSKNKKFGGWMNGWLDGCVEEWMDGWMSVKAILRIAYRNQKPALGF